MRIAKAASLAVAVLIGLALMTSCQQVFTYPLAKALAQPAPSISPDMPLDDTLEIAEKALEDGDKELAASVLDKLLDDIADGGLTADDRNAAISAAVDTAVLTTNVSSALTSVVAAIPADFETITEEDVTGILDILQTVELSADAAAAFSILADEAQAALDSETPLEAADTSTCIFAAAALMADVFSGVTIDPETGFDPGTLTPEQEENAADALTILSAAVLSADEGDIPEFMLAYIDYGLSMMEGE
jgi:hypothetical protein